MKDSNFISMLNEAEKRHGSFSVKCLNFFEKKKIKLPWTYFFVQSFQLEYVPENSFFTPTLRFLLGGL